MQRLTFRAMGCQMLAAVDTDAPEAARRLAQVPAWFEVWEQRLSRFRPDSELSLLNRHAGEQTPVSAVLWEVLRAAQRAARESAGLVLPVLLNELEAAGYNRSFETLIEQTESGLDRAEQYHAATDASIKLDARTQAVYLPPAVRVDLGGVAKGWAADRAAQRLGKRFPALIDAGGDIAISAPPADGRAWPIGVASPFNAHQSLALLMVPRGGVATSGRDYRRWQQNGVWRHHIVDPRTGLPAETDILSATVIAPSAQIAEMAAKVVLILGSQNGLPWLAERPALAGLLVLENGDVLASRRLEKYLWQPGPDTTYATRLPIPREAMFEKELVYDHDAF